MISYTSRSLYTRESAPSTHFTGGDWALEPALKLYGREKSLVLAGIEPRFLGRTACSPTLYRLGYTVSLNRGIGYKLKVHRNTSSQLLKAKTVKAILVTGRGDTE
jgi:hypothetical protein